MIMQYVFIVFCFTSYNRKNKGGKFGQSNLTQIVSVWLLSGGLHYLCFSMSGRATGREEMISIGFVTLPDMLEEVHQKTPFNNFVQEQRCDGHGAKSTIVGRTCCDDRFYASISCTRPPFSCAKLLHRGERCKKQTVILNHII